MFSISSLVHIHLFYDVTTDTTHQIVEVVGREVRWYPEGHVVDTWLVLTERLKYEKQL